MLLRSSSPFLFNVVLHSIFTFSLSIAPHFNNTANIYKPKTILPAGVVTPRLKGSKTITITNYYSLKYFNVIRYSDATFFVRLVRLRDSRNYYSVWSPSQRLEYEEWSGARWRQRCLTFTTVSPRFSHELFIVSQTTSS